MIAFLGTGLLGSGFVRGALGRGESVTVWNRSIGKTEPLAALGARVAADPATAVQGASLVHLVLLGDASVDGVLDQLLSSLAPGTVIIDHSTTSPHGAAARAKRLAAAGVDFLHAPVFMGPPQAESATGMMMVSGPTLLFERARPDLERMTGKVRYMGERPDLAAAYKLFGNMLIMFISSGLADIFALARSLNIDPLDAYTIFNDFNPAGQVATRGKRMAEQNFTASFELSAARKDIRLMLEAADLGGVKLHTLPAIAARFDTLIAAGHGAQDLAVVAIPSIA